jgi:hypothetical protein
VRGLGGHQICGGKDGRRHKEMADRQRDCAVVFFAPENIIDICWLARFCHRFAMYGLILILLLALTVPASADLRIRRDHGGYLEEYKAKYARIRDSGERIIIDGICNGACTVLLGIVPLNRVCVTPRARLGFKEAHYDAQGTAGFWQWTAWFSMTNISATDELMSIYPQSVKDWISRQGGLSGELKYLKNGPELWAIVDPCP